MLKLLLDELVKMVVFKFDIFMEGCLKVDILKVFEVFLYDLNKVGCCVLLLVDEV